jgi:hypothetical protein
MRFPVGLYHDGETTVQLPKVSAVSAAASGKPVAAPHAVARAVEPVETKTSNAA